MVTSELIKVNQVLNKIASQDITDISVVYVIAKNIQALALPLKLFEEKRQELLNQYGERDTAGKLIVDVNNNIRISNQAEFEAKWKELMEADLDIPMSNMKLSKLYNSGVQLDVIDVITISDIIINDMEE